MLCYRDKTYCGSKVEKHTCGREFTEQDHKDAVLASRDEKWREHLKVVLGTEIFSRQLINLTGITPE